MKEVRQVGYFQ